MKSIFPGILLVLSCVFLTDSAFSQDASKTKPKPLKALLITGGCCHDYKGQKDLLKKGIESRANVEVTQVHTDDTTTKARFDLYDNPEWSKGYDVILHDECTSDVVDPKYVENILSAHRNGLPAVNLHCAMHSYRLPGKDDWFQFVGIQSAAHGPQKPLSSSFYFCFTFSTTLGHNSETVGDPRYLDMVTRGLLWSCDKLNAEYHQPLVAGKKE